MNFEEQFDQVKQKLFAMALVYLKQHEDAEDALQETAYAAYKNYGNLRDEERFDPWITTILFRQCHKQYRKRKNRDRLETALRETVFEENYSAQERELIEAVYALPETFRRAVLLKYFGGYQIGEIAGMLKIPEGTVKSRLHKAVALLKERMDEI